MSSVLLMAACGGGSEANIDGARDNGVADVSESADGGAPDGTNDSTELPQDDASSTDAPTDPVFHHVSADAPPGSFGPLCNTDNQGQWAPGWRITVQEDWTRRGAGGSNDFYDIDFDTPDGFSVEVDWTSSIASFGFTDGEPLDEVDFDGEIVTVMDHSDESSSIYSIDFISQSAGGSVELRGAPQIDQVAITAPADIALTQEQAVAVLTTMRRERCAIFDAIGLENAFATATLLPTFDGGDPLGKTPPDSDRRPFDPASGFNTSAAYTQDQLAYIVGYDQATSDCFMANVFPTLPTTIEDFMTFVDPITPTNEDEVAAMEAALAGC